MLKPEFIEIKPTYINKNGALVFKLNEFPLPEGFEAIEKNTVYLPPKYNLDAKGHRHKRKEIFFGFGSGLIFVWLDENHDRQERFLNSDGKLFLVIVPSMLVHTFINTASEPTTLFEFAEITQDVNDVETIAIK